MANENQQGEKKGLGCLFKGLMSLFLFFFVMSIFFSVLGAIFGISDDSIGAIHSKKISGSEEEPKIIKMSLSGVMLRSSDRFEPGLTQEFLQMLDAASKDEKVKGILIKLNTPGGSVTDADLIYQKLKKLRASGKKILLLMDDTCASGGYYVSLGVDQVWALPTTITGSIGVIMQNINLSGLLNHYQITDESIVSGPNKAILSPTQPTNPQHKQIIQAIVDEMYDRFLGLLVENRKIDRAEAKLLADGRIYTAKQALDNKLIDQIGYEQEALEALQKMIDPKGKFSVYEYDIPTHFLQSLGMKFSLQNPSTQLEQLFPNQQLYYLYAPQGLIPLLLPFLKR
jgi:protease-4